MTEKEVQPIMKVNNTNPWCLIGLVLACAKNWMNKGHEITRICLEHENILLVASCSIVQIVNRRFL